MKKKIKIIMVLENLIKYEEGRYKGKFNWIASINKDIHFIYDDIEGNIEIVDYDKVEQRLTIKYGDKTDDINAGSFVRGNIGKILGKVTIDFHNKIGQVFKNNKRDIIIIDREYRDSKISKQGYIQKQKWYKYHCNVCGNEDWMLESHLKEGNNCSVCTNRTPVLGINTIWDTDKWLISIINDDEFCKTHTHSCSDKIFPKCPYCGRIKSNKTTINSIYCKHGIACICNDNFSYPEKVMFSMLEQLKIDFIYHKTFNWSQRKEYDFYFELNQIKYVIETHGNQHYNNSEFTKKGGRTLQEEIDNDTFKKELALNSIILKENYIVIDCKKSKLEFIKQNILKSRLSNIFDLSSIDWLKCSEFACSNLVKIACDYKQNNIELFTGDIATLMNICQGTVTSYLKIGNELGWCIYNTEIERYRSYKNKAIKDILRTGRYIRCIDIEKSFNNLTDCAIYFKTNLNIIMHSNCIGRVCNGERQQYKGYHFKYIEDLTKEEYIKYDIENKLIEIQSQAKLNKPA